MQPVWETHARVEAFKLFLRNNDANDTDVDLIDKDLFNGEIIYDADRASWSWPCTGHMETLINGGQAAKYVEQATSPSGFAVEVTIREKIAPGNTLK